jgi:glycosyltransferase involved in cell wall biosynthesis
MVTKQLPNPLISIIIVVFNGVKTLEDALVSVINQTYNNFELIIIDGGSSDGTLNIIEKYKSKIHIFISEPDTGIYDAMNKGIKLAKGDWIFFLGCDDTLYNVLDKIAPKLTNESTIYYGNSFWNKKQKIYDHKFNFYKLSLRNICHQTIFYPKKVFQLFLYDTKYRTHADYYLNIQLFGSNEFSFIYINEIISNYNDISTSSSNNDSAFNQNKDIIIKENFPYSIYVLYKIRKWIVKKVREVHNE